MEAGECALGGLRVSDWLAEPERFVGHSLGRQRPLERLAALEGLHVVNAERRAAAAEAKSRAIADASRGSGLAPSLDTLGGMTSAPPSPRAPRVMPPPPPPPPSACVTSDGVLDGRVLLNPSAAALEEAALLARVSDLTAAEALPFLGPAAMRDALGSSNKLHSLSFSPGVHGEQLTAGLADVLARSKSIASLHAVGAVLTFASARKLAAAAAASYSLVALALPRADFDADAGRKLKVDNLRSRSLAAAAVLNEPRVSRVPQPARRLLSRFPPR